MTWCSDCSDVQTKSPSLSSSKTTTSTAAAADRSPPPFLITKTCPSCGHKIKCHDQGGLIHDLPGLPAGVKFDPTDQELLEHLEGKVWSDARKLHPLIDEFIPTLEGENGICYTHPEKLPGVKKDGLVRHFFHRPSKAYTTGTRKRRKVHSDSEGGETRWHKTGKTRAVFIGGKAKGYKKILVLYTNYGKQKKPEKTNWVMHQYHLGNSEEEKDGELVVSKVFYQTQPRQCGSPAMKDMTLGHPTKLKGHGQEGFNFNKNKTGSCNPSNTLTDLHHHHYYSNNPPFLSFDQGGQSRSSSAQILPQFTVHDGSSFIP